MKEYIKVTIPVNEKETQEMLIAMLSEEQFDSFEERENELLAFIPEEHCNEEILKETLLPFNLSYTKENMIQQNWNAIWESSFEPVQVEDFVAVRADFHSPIKGVKHEIIITPKMSFGTGHHATTYLMLAEMKNIDFKNKTVIDFGTGTGILAVTAEKLGASFIDAIDIDEWSIENAKENLARNGCSKVKVIQGENLNSYSKADIILANINRHIILEHLTSIKDHLNKNGIVLFSGLLAEDEEMMSKAFYEVGLKNKHTTAKGAWISMICTV
jgi:ribosomal protein L11 methyltransferase